MKRSWGAAILAVMALALAALIFKAHLDFKGPGVIEAPPLSIELSGTTDGTQAPDKTAITITIVNDSGHTLSIERGVSVEKMADFHWMPQTVIEAVADCRQYDATHDWHAAVRIEADAVLKLAPFDGKSCGGQCSESCLANSTLGPGTYRVAVMTREGKRAESPSFKLPPP